jgi:rhodanese-related sulfurtransferase
LKVCIAMTRTIRAATAFDMLADGKEIAFLDLRDIMSFGTGHPLLAAHAPLSHLDSFIGELVPRRGTRIILTDGGEGLAEQGAARLAALGYDDVVVLEGGAPAWKAAGGTLFPEIEVPTKGFGAFAEHHGRPHTIAPLDFEQARDGGEDWIVLDSRPRDEYRNGCIPGGIDAPGADMLRCFHDLVPDPATKVLINCMSFTRGTLGGLSLLAAGVPNDVYVLRHGARGWLLDGLELEIGAERFAAPPSAAAIAAAQIRASRIARRAGLTHIDPAALVRWQGNSNRTTYLFDVRNADEFAAGHFPGSRNAPEGSIIMNPQRFFATRNARIVLIDDDGIRATITALWLSQMGWGTIAVLQDGLGGTLETGAVDMNGPRNDHWLAASERPGDTRRNILDYLDWELGLLADIEASGDMPYRNLIW